MKKYNDPTPPLGKAGEWISKLKAYLISNGMEKVAISALDFAAHLPEKVRSDPKILERVLNLGVEKDYKDGKILIKLRSG